jgi:uncharacterized membrane protein YccC
MDPQLLRNSLKLFVAALLTASIALWSERVAFLWYPLLAVVIVVDDNDDLTVRAASARILGTICGGLVTFLVHSILSGWMGVLVSLVLIVPVLRLFGWEGGLATAGTLSVMFLMTPTYVALDWRYVFARSLDTALGCAVALAVGLLFWPRSAYVELLGADRRLRREITAQLEGLRQGLERGQPRPQPLDAAPLSDAVARMEQLVQRERGGPRQQRLRASGWERRLRHWQLVLFHWLAWERLLATLPPLSGREAPLLERSVEELLGQLAGQNLPTPARDAGAWRQLALARGLPVLSLLALAEELRPLHTNLGSLGRREPC